MIGWWGAIDLKDVYSGEGGRGASEEEDWEERDKPEITIFLLGGVTGS